jgi:hypothetical protein
MVDVVDFDPRQRGAKLDVAHLQWLVENRPFSREAMAQRQAAVTAAERAARRECAIARRAALSPQEKYEIARHWQQQKAASAASVAKGKAARKANLALKALARAEAKLEFAQQLALVDAQLDRLRERVEQFARGHQP